MKTTTTANIGGINFTIDEDAFNSLNTYLKDIEEHLHDSDSKTEIMQDIEARIAELFQQHLQFSHMEVVNLTMVNDIIQQLGKPEVISDGFEAEAEETEAIEAETIEAEETTKETNEKSKKKLYRDVSNQLLGGVCSGIGKRIGIDAIWLRLIFAVLFFFNGTGLLFYLLLWIIIPAANTTARRLEMNGIEPSAENIRQAVESEGSTTPHPRSTTSTLMIGCLGIMALPFIFIILIVIFALAMALLGVGAAAIPFAGMFGITDAAIGSGLVFIISALLAICIPIGVVITWAVQRNKSDKGLPKAFWITALILWLLSLIGITCGGIHVSKSVNNMDWQNAKEQIEEYVEGLDQMGDSLENKMDSLAAAYDDYANSDVIEGELEVTDPE